MPGIDGLKQAETKKGDPDEIRRLKIADDALEAKRQDALRNRTIQEAHPYWNEALPYLGVAGSVALPWLGKAGAQALKNVPINAMNEAVRRP
jgi:hypothetical protein